MIDHSDGSGAPETGLAKVTVIVPCRAEYVAIARLAILGVANRLAYSYDEVEDVRLAVGEACTHAVARAQNAVVAAEGDASIWIECQISPDGLRIEVRDNVPASASDNVETADFDEDEFDKQDLGALLMEILVDSVTIDIQPTGTTIKLFKAAPQPN